MPKSQATNKAKVTDSQITGAPTNANAKVSAGADDGSANSSTSMEKSLDYATLCRVINEHFDAFQACLQTRTTTQAELQVRTTNQELTANDHEARLQELEAKCSELANQNTLLHAKVLDLEARSRRHNIKIVGIPEGEENGKPTEFVSNLIPKLLGEENFPYPIKVDRAHRSLQPKPAAGKKSRTIIARIHHSQAKESSLRQGRQCDMEYKGNKVLIFPDYTNEVMAQRRAFRDVMQLLHEGGIKHTLRYPARLHIYQREGEAPTTFNDPKEATQFMETINTKERE